MPYSILGCCEIDKHSSGLLLSRKAILDVLLQQGDLIYGRLHVSKACLFSGHSRIKRILHVLCGHKLYAEQLVTVIIFSRLTPTYAFCILLSVTLWPKFGKGPLWPEVVHPLSENCRKYWWSNLLYINNFYPSTEAEQVIT